VSTQRAVSERVASRATTTVSAVWKIFGSYRLQFEGLRTARAVSGHEQTRNRHSGSSLRVSGRRASRRGIADCSTRSRSWRACIAANRRVESSVGMGGIWALPAMTSSAEDGTVTDAAHSLDPKRTAMHHPDLRHHARDRIAAAEVVKLDLLEVELRAARGEPGVIETPKPRRAAPGPAKRALSYASRLSPPRGGCRLSPWCERRATVRRQAGQAPEDAALYRCHCGLSFAAAVTTCVACPTCGTGQAW
jgi:hypothetical protein